MEGLLQWACVLLLDCRSLSLGLVLLAGFILAEIILTLVILPLVSGQRTRRW